MKRSSLIATIALSCALMAQETARANDGAKFLDFNIAILSSQNTSPRPWSCHGTYVAPIPAQSCVVSAPWPRPTQVVYAPPVYTQTVVVPAPQPVVVAPAPVVNYTYYTAPAVTTYSVYSLPQPRPVWVGAPMVEVTVWR